MTAKEEAHFIGSVFSMSHDTGGTRMKVNSLLLCQMSKAAGRYDGRQRLGTTIECYTKMEDMSEWSNAIDSSTRIGDILA